MKGWPWPSNLEPAVLASKLLLPPGGRFSQDLGHTVTPKTVMQRRTGTGHDTWP